jgi:aminomuconate-semialdehyde/2-hydroxymuconate-6-semialdehyde dehydrogenase
MKKILNYINGQLLPPSSGRYLDNHTPSTGEVYSFIPDSSEEDVEMAIDAAKKAFPIWSKMPVERRANYLQRLADAINAHMESLALAESEDNGKPLWLAKSVDIPRAVSNFRFYASGILHFHSDAHLMGDEAINYTRHEPLGVVACISPWNLPLYLFTWKIAPALAAGNTVVAKPSELTPMTAFMLSELAIACGFPEGVLNIVHGTGPSAGEAMVKHKEVKAISFTGGTNTGQRIAALAAPAFKKLSLELGGKNPSIIFEDANYEEALKGAVRSGFSNQGQICLCGSRLYVQRSIYDRFKKDLVERVKRLHVGDPLDEKTKVGALVSEAHLQKVLAYVELAKEEGGFLLCGGERIHLEGKQAGGYYMSPAIIEGLDIHCRTNQEEIFGPVVTLHPFDTEEEAIALANGTPYGLAANLWTQELSRAHRVAASLDFGIVWINTWLLRDLRTPFGGMKQSGMGREGGMEAFRFFTEEKNVCIQIGKMPGH